MSVKFPSGIGESNVFQRIGFSVPPKPRPLAVKTHPSRETTTKVPISRIRTTKQTAKHLFLIFFSAGHCRRSDNYYWEICLELCKKFAVWYFLVQQDVSYVRYKPLEQQNSGKCFQNLPCSLLVFICPLFQLPLINCWLY